MGGSGMSSMYHIERPTAVPITTTWMRIESGSVYQRLEAPCCFRDSMRDASNILPPASLHRLERVLGSLLGLLLLLDLLADLEGLRLPLGRLRRQLGHLGRVALDAG